MTILERLNDDTFEFTRSERMIIRTLLSNYPTVGLTTASELAAQSGVSDPTVVRFVKKLGFDGYPGFQKALLSEIDERLNSPLTMFETKRSPSSEPSVFRDFVLASAKAIESAGKRLNTTDLRRALELTTNPQYRISLLGGRYSRFLAGYFQQHLVLLRGNTRVISDVSSDQIDSLIDYSNSDVLVAFDFRRYQTNVIRYCELVGKTGAKIILFTDPWLSPISKMAEAVIVAPTDTVSPFDSYSATFVQIEAFVATMTNELGDAALDRLRSTEELATIFERREARETNPG